jgi:hypothetical protein
VTVSDTDEDSGSRVDAPPTRLDYVRAWSDLGLFLALALGVVAAVFVGWRIGAIIAVAALAASVLLHVVNGAIEYRRVMRRPWPAVDPLRDDDDD